MEYILVQVIEIAFCFSLRNIRSFGKVTSIKVRNEIFYQYFHFYYASVVADMPKKLTSLEKNGGEKNKKLNECSDASGCLSDGT